MLPIIHVGPAAIQSSIISFAAALLIGGMLAEAIGHRRGLKGDATWNVIALGSVVTVVAARLVYVVENWTAYASDWSSLFALTPGTLDLEYGALCGLIAAVAYLRHQGISLAGFADSAAPGALVAMAIWAVGQFLSGDAYGDTTNVPWAISLYGEFRHPVQLYEAFATLVGALVVWWFARRSAPVGSVALLAVIWYAGARVFVDAFRGDETLLFDEYRMTQVVALLVLLAALWGFSRLVVRQDESAIRN